MVKFSVSIFIIILTSTSCKKDVLQPNYKSSYLSNPKSERFCKIPDTISYRLHIEPLINRNCYSCHNSDCAITLIDYKNLSIYSGQIMFADLIKHHTTTSNTVLTDCEIDLVLNWIKQGQPDN